jgi:hypothetical protein
MDGSSYVIWRYGQLSPEEKLKETTRNRTTEWALPLVDHYKRRLSVSLWHKADMALAPVNVCFRG